MADMQFRCYLEAMSQLSTWFCMLDVAPRPCSFGSTLPAAASRTPSGREAVLELEDDLKNPERDENQFQHTSDFND